MPPKITNLNKLLDLYPINLNEPTALNEKMKEGLAQVYANEGFRIYLENAIKTANMNVMKALDVGDTEKAKRAANRMETLMKLISKGREAYSNFEKLRNAKNNQEIQS